MPSRKIKEHRNTSFFAFAFFIISATDRPFWIKVQIFLFKSEAISWSITFEAFRMRLYFEEKCNKERLVW